MPGRVTSLLLAEVKLAGVWEWEHVRYRITNRLRPIRIGMLSGLMSPESFVRCIEICTALWGARYNPILPAIASAADWPEVAARGPMTPADVLRRWARTFDADIFARMEDAAPELTPSTPSTMRGPFDTVTDWRTVLSANNGTASYGSGYGVGLLEVARDYLEREARFVRQPPFRLVSPTIAGHAALSAVLFGRLDSFLAERYHQTLSSAGHEVIEVEVTEALRFTSPNFVTPLAMSDRHLRHEGLVRHEFYVLREDQAFDLALFWNVRTHEPNVIPLTLELLSDNAVLDELRSLLNADDGYADSTRRVFVGTADGYYLREVLDRLALPSPSVNYLLWPTSEEYGPSDWTPDAFSTTMTTAIDAEHGRVTVNAIGPDILRADWRTGFRFANDVTLRSITGNHLPADVVPRDAMDAVSDVNTMRLWHMPWRVASEGFAFFPFRGNTEFDFEPPDARAVMRAFFSHAGFTHSTSEHGMLLEQLLERLGGPTASGVVTHEALHLPVRKLDGRGTILAATLFSMLSDELGREAALSVIGLLVTNGVFAQGMMQQCPLCNHSPWFALTSLQSQLLCEYCRGSFSAELVGNRHRYLLPAMRILPPLDIPKNREGLLAVLAVLNFLRGAFGSERLTIGAGVKVDGYGFNREYDVVALARGLAASTLVRVLFCESSAHTPFDDADFERFERVLPHFPTAYFAFATLRDPVADHELARIRAFARTNGPAGKPQHRVIVLTGADLTPRGDRYMPDYHGPDLRYFVEERAARILAS